MHLSYSNNRRQISQFLRQKLLEKPVFLDTETTGLDRTDEIVEISIVDDEGSVLFSSLVRPSQPIPRAAMQIHGITDEMVREMKPWPFLWPEVRPHLAGRLVVIYNAEFDIRMMQQSHARYRLPWRENLNILDAMQLYAEYRGEWDRARRSYRIHKLEMARQQCLLTIPNAHRATADALLARALLHYMADHE